MRYRSGTIVRHVPDFDPQHMMIGIMGQANLSVANNLQEQGLFNNSDDGTYLVVWDCTLHIAIGSGATVGLSQANWGVNPGFHNSGVSPGVPMIPGGAVGPGICWANNNPPGLNITPYEALQDGGQWQWPHDWPMCWIPPQFSLVISFQSNLTAGNAPAESSLIYQWGVSLP